MAPRIERALGALFGQNLIRRQKESSDRDPSQGPGYEGNGAGGHKKGEGGSFEENQAQLKPAVTREALEKAVASLRDSSHFSQTGLRAEVVNSPDGLQVRLTQASGATVKTMTAEEFMRLEKSTAGEQETRGKILDQKF